MSLPDPVVHAAAEAARRAARAQAGRVLAGVGDELRVAAVAGTESGWRQGEAVPADAEGVGYVLASGQPLSVGASEAGGRPTLCVPCTFEGEPLGVLELIGRPGEEAFPISATEVTALFAGVAAAALAAGGTTSDVPAPRELAAELARLGDTDPTRYASVARAVSALLS